MDSFDVFHSNNQLTRCARPWASLMLYPNASGPECHLSNAFMQNTSEKSINEIWNGTEFVKLREKILENQYPALCNECPEKNSGIDYYSQFEYMKFSSQSKDNFQLNRDEYIKGNTKLESNPFAISVDLQYPCNFQCGMCDLRFSKEKITLKQEQELFNQYAGSSVHMHFSGGEPLLHKGFLEYLQSGAQKPTSISITTNGSLLSRGLLDSLLSFPYVNLHISIDSFDTETFAKLRPGPLGLNEILEKVKLAVEYKERINKQTSERRWHVCLQMVPILNNIEEFPQYIDYAYNMNIDEISSCSIAGDFPDQDFTKYPNILDSIDVPPLLSKIKNRMKKYTSLEISQMDNYLSALTSYTHSE